MKKITAIILMAITLTGCAGLGIGGDPMEAYEKRLTEKATAYCTEEYDYTAEYAVETKEECITNFVGYMKEYNEDTAMRDDKYMIILTDGKYRRFRF